MRVRGLKPPVEHIAYHRPHVAPRAGAWVETYRPPLIYPCTRVAPRAGAWVETIANVSISPGHLSHPVRVRGLKPYRLTIGLRSHRSHPVRVRGLKP